MVIIIIIIKYVAYDLCARLGLANSERIVCQITSDAFKLKKKLFCF